MTTYLTGNYLCCMLLLLAAASFPCPSYGQNFSIPSTSYNCTPPHNNLICLGAAHVGQSDGNKTFSGRLSLLWEQPWFSIQSSGLAYYKKPVRILDPSSGKSASFNTSFTIDTTMQMYKGDFDRLTGDGMTFVMSAANNVLGGSARFLGIFNTQGKTNFKSIVVEFDDYMNTGPPAYDISHNHVSFDFSQMRAAVAANASDVGIRLWYNLTTYAWLEYSAETQRLELRISNKKSRPIKPLLNYTVDLFDVAEEYMWVGFSAGSGDTYNHFYIGDWTFEAYGIPLPPDPSKNRSKVGLVVGVSAGSLLLLAIAAFFILCFVCRLPRVRKWRLGDYVEEEEILELSNILRRVSYKHLNVATKSFGNDSKLGQGGFGSVYGGVLPTTGTPIAVKKISSDSNQGEREFITEISIISQLRHRNLIQLLGWCKDKGKYLLVYELMPNGSLDKVLFLPEDQPSSLSWKQRFNIVLGTARALDYLHQGWKQQVIHRDIKASNIMLDNEWNAKLGDFGLARLVDHLRTAPTTVVAGTYGYIAPEAASGRFTDKTDVFAFGAVALEIACGRKAYNVHGSPFEIVLVDWVWERLSEGNLLSVVDRKLAEYDTYWMEVLLLLGLLCSHPDPQARPTMRKVVQVLAGEATVPSVPGTKPALSFKSDSQKISIGDLHSPSPRAVRRSGNSSGSGSESSDFSDSTRGALTSDNSSN